MGWSSLFLILYLSWAFFFPTTHELQTYNYQKQLLLQLRKHLEYPSQLEIWQSHSGELCNLSPTSHMSIICQENTVTELRIMGDKLPKVRDYNGFPILNQTLAPSFSIDSFFTTLTRFTSLRVVSLVSLGIWGSLPDKISRLHSLELLDLSSNFIFGSVPFQLSRLVKLSSLTLAGNYFNETVPDWLDSFSNLNILILKNNSFTGQFPSSICRITTLTDIALSHNQLSGKLPDLSMLTSLNVLDLEENKLDSGLPVLPQRLVTVLLSNNSFSGKIPRQFGALTQLQHLDLSLNRLTGTPPTSLFSLKNISYLNLASNMLSGSVPSDITCGSKLGFVDISANKLIGALPSCLDGKSDERAVKFDGNCLSVDVRNQHQEPYCKEANVDDKQSRGRAVGILVAVICGAVLVMGLFAFGILFLCRRYRSNNKSEQNIISNVVEDNTSTGVSSEVLANSGFISQAAKLGIQGAPASRVFSLEELIAATNNFDSLSFIGEGSTGKVYRGRLENGTCVAIRSLDSLTKHSIQSLKVRLDLLSKLHHPHLVALLGHCIHANEQDDPLSIKVFLVHEYVPNGNYRSHLSEKFPIKILNWSSRLAILIGVAKAVHFLHTGVIPAVLNNRLKTNSILLDEHWVAKLSDYGMSILVEEIENFDAKGEEPKSRHMINMEDDVYNFGFILLESFVGPIVTGKGEAFLLNELASFGSHDGRRRIVDPVVLTTCSQESLSIVVSITSKCICPEPSARPSFEDVLWNLQYAAQVQATADADQKSD